MGLGCFREGSGAERLRGQNPWSWGRKASGAETVGALEKGSAERERNEMK